MKVTQEFHKDGTPYWLAVGSCFGRATIAEGTTRKEAIHYWCYRVGIENAKP